MQIKIDYDKERLRAFCEKWQIAELSIFGSAIRDDFGPHSDVDLLVTFKPTSEWSLLDDVAMQDELAEFFGRPVDLISRRGLERSKNILRKRDILDSARVIYAAA